MKGSLANKDCSTAFIKQVLPRFCNPTGERSRWLLLPDDANRLRALIGRAGDARTTDARGTAPVRGDCSDGNDVLLLTEVAAATLAAGGGAEVKFAYNAELGFNGCCDRAASDADALNA